MTVGKLGYVIPLALLGGVFNTVGSGLLSTLQPKTTTGQWVGYLIISGIGRGTSIQMVNIVLSSLVGFTNPC